MQRFNRVVGISLYPRARVSSGQRQETELSDNPLSGNPDSGFRFQGLCVSVMAAKSKRVHHFHETIQFSLRKLGKAEPFFLKEQQAL